METKEKIKSRMLKNAAKIWGYKDTELETSYDPLVGLLMGSLSNELEKISSEIHSSQGRILDRLAKLLTPDTLIGSKPAHGILHARPTESQVTINPEYQFYTISKIANAVNSNKEIKKEIFFSPSSSTTLFNGDVEFLVAGNNFFKLINSFQKELLFDSEKGQPGDSSSLWVGIDLDTDITSLNNLSFYFDLKNEAEKIAFFHNLPNAKWFHNDKELITIPGINNSQQGSVKMASSLSNEINLTYKIENFINSLYHHFFITIGDGFRDNSKQKIVRSLYPPEFEKTFAKKDLEKIEKELVWIKINFPSSASTNSLSDIFCSMNCFPVMNRKLDRFSYRLQDNLNIIPLSTEDLYLDMKTVYSSDGTLFESKPLSYQNKLQTGTYTHRHGGVGRFDSRDASEMITHLLDLLRDESAAFAAMGNEFISSEIKQLNQILASIGQKVGNDSFNKETLSYLMVKSRGQFENIFIEFWTTNGQLANNMRPGSSLELYFGGDLKQDSIFLVTSTSGGRDKLNSDESLNVYKETVLNRGRVITKEDIRSVCFSKLGQSIYDVKVKKGIETSSKAKNGLVRTIDVLLTPSNENKHSNDEWLSMCHELKVTLENQSTGMYPLRVMVSR